MPEVGERRSSRNCEPAGRPGVFGPSSVRQLIALKVVTAVEDGSNRRPSKRPSYDVIRPRAVLRFMEAEAVVGEGSALTESRFTLADGIHQLKLYQP